MPETAQKPFKLCLAISPQIIFESSSFFSKFCFDLVDVFDLVCPNLTLKNSTSEISRITKLFEFRTLLFIHVIRNGPLQPTTTLPCFNCILRMKTANASFSTIMFNLHALLRNTDSFKRMPVAQSLDGEEPLLLQQVLKE